MYQALYRKYRPMDFDSVVGQNAIVKTLKNSIIHHSFSHAYLFIGPRGTGKTTLSKIFARNINCLDSKDGHACGKCPACLYSFSKECMDILEIDAASNNGVDEIRELRNKISLVPSELKYKVYIIDEVHMLSIGAFNALLKTLEEPPEHAVFILATTDPQKVPETIVSRCQTFSFQRISSSCLKQRLEFVCSKENIQIDSDVLDQICSISDGGMRDALGLLDKLTSYTNDKITLDDFYEINGSISESEINNFLNSILNGNISDFINLLDRFDSEGKNLIQILSQLLIYNRNLLVDYYINNSISSFSIPLLHELSSFLNEKMFDIKKSSNTKIYIELLLLKFMNDNVINTNKTSPISLKVEQNNNAFISINEKEKSIKNENELVANDNLDNVPLVDVTTKLDNNNNNNNNNNSNNDDDDFDFDSYFDDNQDNSDDSNISSDFPIVLNYDEIMSVRVNNTLALADKKLLNEELKKFDLLKDFTFDQEIGYIVCSLLDAKLRVVSPNNMILSYDSDASVKQNLLTLDKMIEVYNKITGSDKNIAIISDSDWESIKKEYILNIKNGISYEIKDEPKLVFEELSKNDIIGNSAIDLFGDIVEIE